MNRLRLLLWVGCAFALGALVAVAALPSVRDQFVVRERHLGQALVGGPFVLTDQTGKRVTEKDFRGKHMLIMFGFTFCPDVCPTGLQVVAAALDALGTKADRITPIFVTVDPERDTPPKMAQYVASFHPRMVGLTGTSEEIAAAAKAYRVYYKRVKDDASSAAYTIDHSALIYLMGPDGTYITHFSHATSAETMAQRLGKVL